MSIIYYMITGVVGFALGYTTLRLLERYKWKNIHQHYMCLFIDKEDVDTINAVTEVLIQQSIHSMFEDTEPYRNRKDSHLSVVKEKKDDS